MGMDASWIKYDMTDVSAIWYLATSVTFLISVTLIILFPITTLDKRKIYSYF